MKAALLIILVLIGTAVYKAQPDIPKDTCKVINEVLANYCLVRIPKYYDAEFLTYAGHTWAGIYRYLNKFGMNLNEQQTRYLSAYSSLEDAVNCHVTASGDASLNMTITPVEFDAMYKLILKKTKKTELQNIQVTPEDTTTNKQ